MTSAVSLHAKYDEVSFWDLAKNIRFTFAIVGQVFVGFIFAYWGSILNPMLLTYYGMPPEKSTLIFLSSAPCYILFAPLAFKLLEKKLIRRRTLIYLVMSFWGVLCIFATGNLQIINDSSKIWQVIICMGLGGGCLAIMYTTVFPELVEQAENSLFGRKVDREKLNVYLCSLFFFLSSVS